MAVSGRCCRNAECPQRNKFGAKLRTPVMQAGISTLALSFREIFTAVAGPLSRVYWILDFGKAQATMKPLWEAA